MIRTLLTFWWKRDSVSAACVIIDFAQHMSAKHLSEIADYLHGLASDKQRREEAQ